MKKAIIFAGILAAILLMAAYFSKDNSNSSIAQMSTLQTIQSTNQIPVRGSVNNQTQCTADGKLFFHNAISDDVPASAPVWTYDGPEYYSSQKMNTCLVYFGEISPFNSTNSSTFYNLYVYDIYRNQSQPILLSATQRTCPQGGECTEVPNTIFDTMFSNVPNLSTNDFNAQKGIMFSQ